MTTLQAHPIDFSTRKALGRLFRRQVAEREAVTASMYIRLREHERRAPLRELYEMLAESAERRAKRYGQSCPSYGFIDWLAILVAPYLGLRFVTRYERETLRLKFALLATAAAGADCEERAPEPATT